MFKEPLSGLKYSFTYSILLKNSESLAKITVKSHYVLLQDWVFFVSHCILFILGKCVQWK